jgi:hypothetical protein
MIDTLNIDDSSDFLFYSGPDGSIRVEVIIGEETVWASQAIIAEIFDTTRQNVTMHIANIYTEGELEENRTSKDSLLVQNEGNREVNRRVILYNLDMIIAIGYRINSYNATQFRIWATKILKEYMVKGFALDDARLKQGKTVFGKDYFDELLQRIREIRASERRFYQKVTDLYALSADYDPKSPITKEFFAFVQNKLEYAITGQTASEIVRKRADAKLPHMGLQTWSKPDGKIILKDTLVAKNYLKEEEINELNRLVNSYLDYAELQASRQKLIKMVEWVSKLDAFLKFNEYAILADAGKVSKANAEKHAKKEYEKFRVRQDKEFKSDFDKIASQVLVSGKLPSEKQQQPQKPSSDPKPEDND